MTRLNDEIIAKLKTLHEKLQAQNIPEDRYHLLGIFGSTSDDQKLCLNVKHGKYTILYEVYQKDSDEKHIIFETANIDEAFEVFLKRV
jgi:hypothetical protein